MSQLPGEERHWQLAADGAGCGGLVLFPLEIPAAARSPFGALLSDAEAARAARFRSPTHAQRYAVAHGRLRQLLGSELGLEPRTLEFTSGADGKPALAGAAAGSGLQFNLSHSGGLGLVGWSWGREIGVDVEVWRTMRDEAALVRRYFSSVEVAAWEALPAAARRGAFFNLWTRKEAYVKALGRGLGLALDSFDVSHEDGAGARLLRSSALAGDERAWTLVAPVVEQAASIAVVIQAGTLTASPPG